MPQDHETIKHAADAIAVSAGVGTSAAFWLSEIINPLLSALVLIATLIWTVYRIREMRDKRQMNKSA